MPRNNIQRKNFTATIKREGIPSNPPPARAYQGLKVGHQTELDFQNNITPPVHGENALLRSLSPFKIQVEPPLIYASEPALLNPSNKQGLGLYQAALKGNQRFAEARNRLVTSRFATADFGVTSIEEFVSTSDGQPRKAPTGSREPLDPSGQPSRTLGKPSIADLNSAVDIALQLKAILETPPLILLINPESLTKTYTRIQQYSDRTKYGFVFQAWGVDQVRISISARCGAFLSAGRGVQEVGRADSASWQNMMTLYQFYKNNGYIFDTIGKSYAHHMVGALSIHYDQWIYYGNIESFNWSHDTTNIHGGVTFSMEFVANTIVDTASQVLNVVPMRSPTPNPSDYRVSRGGVGQTGPSGQAFEGAGVTLDPGLELPSSNPTQGFTTLPQGFNGFTTGE